MCSTATRVYNEVAVHIVVQVQKVVMDNPPI